MNENATAVADEESIHGKTIDAAQATFLEESEEGIDSTADQFGFPPPPEDGRYTAKLSYDQEFSGPDKVKAGEVKTGDNKGKKYAQMKVVAEILDGPHEGRQIFKTMNTLVSDRGTNEIAGMLMALGVELPPRVTGKALLEMAYDALAVQPSAFITGRWEASWKLDNGTYKRIRGMKNFLPVIDKEGQPVVGKYQHDYVDRDGNEVKAYFTITRFESAE